MKKSTIVIIALMFFFSAMAQDKDADFEYTTLFNGLDITSHGGYGAYTVAYTQIGDNDALMTGGSGLWLMNHVFGLGFGGFGFNTLAKQDPILNNDRYQYSGGYGGLIVEPILFPGKVIHVSFPVLIGAGGISYIQSDYADWNNYYEDSQAFFVVEPRVVAEVNLVKYMRLGVWVAYRYTTNINLKYYASGAAISDKGAMRGISGGLTFKFGKF